MFAALANLNRFAEVRANPMQGREHFQFLADDWGDIAGRSHTLWSARRFGRRLRRCFCYFIPALLRDVGDLHRFAGELQHLSERPQVPGAESDRRGPQGARRSRSLDDVDAGACAVIAVDGLNLITLFRQLALPHPAELSPVWILPPN